MLTHNISDSLSSLLPAAPIRQNGRKSRKLYAVPIKRPKPQYKLWILSLMFRSHDLQTLQRVRPEQETYRNMGVGHALQGRT